MAGSSYARAATRQWRIGRTTSPTMRTSWASSASASSVADTPPSIEFSIGTTARSTARSWTAITASWIVPYGTSSTAAGADPRRASRLLLLRRQLQLGHAVVQLLDVHAGLVAMDDRRDDDAGAAGVEQRHAARLVPPQPALGVVAGQRPGGEETLGA